MKSQRDPTAARLRQLCESDPHVDISWGEVSPSSLNDSQRAGIDREVELVDEAKKLLADPAGRQSAHHAAQLDDRLTDIGGKIGAQLRQLNAGGIYIAAQRGCEAYTVEDPETGDQQSRIGPVVRLNILRRAAA